MRVVEQTEPRIAEQKLLVASIGGSELVQPITPWVLFWQGIRMLGGEQPNVSGLNLAFVGGLIELCKELSKKDYSLVMITGGGARARQRVRDLRARGVENAEQLDHAAIAITQANAVALRSLFESNHLEARFFHETFRGRNNKKAKKGLIYVDGGSTPGHTTDFVTVEAALRVGADVLVNIGRTPGLYPFTKEGKPDTSWIVPSLRIKDYLRMFPSDVEHTPAESLPFDRPGAKLADRSGVTVILVGGNLNNLRRLTAGEPFIGTILTPSK